ncbi:hypothetical protein BS78_04G265800 [Paspalum vaginatum]|nr:hypothetical protein BS78_04G265800 [Paspalum vaginatum]
MAVASPTLSPPPASAPCASFSSPPPWPPLAPPRAGSFPPQARSRFQGTPPSSLCIPGCLLPFFSVCISSRAVVRRTRAIWVVDPCRPRPTTRYVTFEPEPCDYSNHSSSVVKNEFWLVRMEKPGVEVVTKAQMVDHYTQILMKVLGNEQDAQVSIYHISWEKHYGFCCHIDEECAKELADIPGVLSVQPDTNFGSDNKDYKGDDDSKSSEGTGVADIKSKRLFVTGLSFYTSEKTLRAAFEPFGQLVEVKIIMDKISKRSKGYAFIEYTTEEAGGAALKAMNGQVTHMFLSADNKRLDDCC